MAHTPVMLKETLEILNVHPGGAYADFTLGGAGHASAIIQAMQTGFFLGVDKDPQAVKRAREALSKTADQNGLEVAFHLHNGDFKDILSIAAKYHAPYFDGILFDFGVSSFQLDDRALGFSYMANGPLDMRMTGEGTSAADIVNNYSEQELERIIKEYGQERWARRIAQFIIKERSQTPITTTRGLVEVIQKAVPRGARREGPHPAKRTFQALRIETNKELSAIETAVRDGFSILAPGGCMVCISFHSLEDVLVKNIFNEFIGKCVCPKELPLCVCGCERTGEVLTKKPVTPSPLEIEANPRSRSALLRAIRKL